MVLEKKTKAELLEIIKDKETEILDLKEELRQLEKCEKYENITDEIRGAYDMLTNKGFTEAAALELVETMLTSGNIPARTTPRFGYAYNPHY